MLVTHQRCVPRDATHALAPAVHAANMRRASGSGHLVEGCHDVLDLGVLLERVDRHVLAVAALLVPAMRHLVDERDVRVDPHGSKLQPPGHSQRTPHVTGPHGRRQPVVDGVRPFQRLVLVAEALDGDDGAEHLSLDDLGLGSGRQDYGRLVPRPRALDARAPVAISPPALRARSTKPDTRSSCSSETSGPISVSAAAGSPTLRDSTAGTRSLTSLSWIRGPAMTRVAEVQSWPALKKPPILMPSTTALGSASSKTTTGALPPSSRWTRFSVDAASRAM